MLHTADWLSDSNRKLENKLTKVMSVPLIKRPADQERHTIRIMNKSKQKHQNKV